MSESIVEMLKLGGPVVWLLIAMSVMAVAVFVVKLMQYTSLGLFDLQRSDKAVDYWVAGNDKAAVEFLKKIDPAGIKPLPQMLIAAMTTVTASNINEHISRETAARIAADHIDKLRTGLRVLEVIATTAPLLGLLGTVLGMIEAFKALEDAGSQVDPAILSGGIWVALLTTAVGLIVAIPAVFMLNFLERIMERLHHNLQSATTRIFTRDAEQVLSAD